MNAHIPLQIFFGSYSTQPDFRTSFEDDEKAFDVFYELLDKFCIEKGERDTLLREISEECPF